MWDDITSTHSKEHQFVSRKWMLLPGTVNISNVNFTTKYLYRQSQYSNAQNSKCLALIAQVVRAFGMNPKVLGSNLPQNEPFSVYKLRHFQKNIRSLVKNERCCPRTVNISLFHYLRHIVCVQLNSVCCLLGGYVCLCHYAGPLLICTNRTESPWLARSQRFLVIALPKHP